MIVRAIDTNHDWTYGSGLNNYSKNQVAIVQNLNTRLNSFLGDCFFDTTAGVDWFNLGTGKDQIALSLAISAVILNTTDIVALVQLSINLVDRTRSFTVTYQVQSVYSVNPIPGGTSIILA